MNRDARARAMSTIIRSLLFCILVLLAVSTTEAAEVSNAGNVATLKGGDNSSGHTVTNTGNVSGTVEGSDNAANFSTGGSNTINNSGTVGDGAGTDYVAGSWNVGDGAAGGSNTITNSGTITGTLYGSYNRGDSATAATGGSNSITNTSTGRVNGNVVGSYNGQSTNPLPNSGGGNVIVNEGQVTGYIYGSNNVWVVAGGVTFSTGNTINNSGTVGGDIYGAKLNGGSSTTGDDRITNSGSVGGGIFGEDGNDTITLATGGSVAGNVDGGPGTDNLVLDGSGKTSDFTLLNLENLRKTGAGTWNLDSNLAFTGTAASEGGTLAVNGTLNVGVLDVKSGGSVGGTGTVAGSLLVGGTIAPGNSIGTINATSYTSNAGSTYQVEIDNAGNSDLINVTTTATLNGGRVQPIPLGDTNTYTDGTRYTIVTAGGGVTGTYDGITDNAARLDFSLSYDPNNVYLTITTVSAFETFGRTYNQRRVARALDRTDADTRTAGDMRTVLNNLYTLSEANLLTALDGLHAEGYAAAAGVSFSRLLRQRALLSERLIGLRQNEGLTLHASLQPDVKLAYGPGPVKATPVPQYPWRAWAQTYGVWEDQDRAGDYFPYETETFGALAGLDRRYGNLLVGFAFGGGNADLEFDGSRNTIDMETLHAGLYATYARPLWFVDGAFSYGWNDYESKRNIDLTTEQRTAHADYEGNEWLASLEAGRHVNLKHATLTPFAGLNIACLEIEEFTEDDAGSVNLEMDSMDEDRITSLLGLRLSRRFERNGVSLLPAAHATWAHTFDAERGWVDARLAGAPSGVGHFDSRGAEAESNAALLGVSLKAAWNERFAASVGYDCELLEEFDAHRASLGLTIAF